jgi:PAS domain S-box-containing protein
MNPLETLDITLLVNSILSLTIVCVSLWGYHRIGKPTPLYFGAAYALFATSHWILLTGMTQQVPAIVLIVMRTTGYILVAVGLFALLQDILERIRAEEALKESEDHLQATFAQTAVGIMEFLPDGNICRYNRKFTEILGGDENVWLSQSLWNVISESDHLLHFDPLNAVFRGDRQEYSGEMLLKRHNGTQVWCQTSVSGVMSPEGKPKYFILVIADISERILAEQELASLNAGLEQRVLDRTLEIAQANDKLLKEIDQRSHAEECLKTSLKEKDVLIKEIHHRVKNNLQIIVSLLYLQAQKTSDTVSANALIDSQTRVKSMAIIHEKLYQSENLSSIDFEAYLQNLVANLMVSYDIDKKRVGITIAAKNLPLTINTAIPLGLMMNELVSNALKYAFPEGRTGKLEITGRVDGNTIQIRVKDDGVGIPVEFDWKNTKSLGLHLVQMLTRQLKGTVDLARDGGTEFTVTVPVSGGL